MQFLGTCCRFVASRPLLRAGLCIFALPFGFAAAAAAPPKGKLERIVVSPDGRGFIRAESKTPFHPWGMNYGNAGRLMEDFWDEDWETFASDFREMKKLGANVVRVHLQFGKFMAAPARANPAALRQYIRMLRLAEQVGIYVDVTGLACYRPIDSPAWYDDMDEAARWTAQANFWAAVAEAGAGSPAVFCYDLMNEPISPPKKREPGQWRSGRLFGDYDFLQYIAIDPAGRSREAIVAQWLGRMIPAIRKHDPAALITVGLLPWSQRLRHLSGFLPEHIAPPLDFISVHIYPHQERPAEAMEALRKVGVGKPVVIEETFLLSCNEAQLEKFMRDSREIACGWIGHYDGLTPEEATVLEKAKKLTLPQHIYRTWAQMMIRLKPKFVANDR
ncbi:MAG: cellulase family glycosylhydrolase [Opitutaceae bacterium]|nr:cellulase family glycosylhydrolase [Opitutaceae bacterium]